MSNIKVEISPDNATDKSFSVVSSDEKVVSVDEKNVCTALAAGTATLTITTKDGGFTAETVVTVKPKVVKVTGAKAAPATLEATVGETINVTL